MGNNINEVRQILMNEMGLTREFIREETRKIIEETAEKYLRHLLERDELGEILLRAANKQLGQRNAMNIEFFLRAGAKEAADRWISENVKIKAQST